MAVPDLSSVVDDLHKEMELEAEPGHDIDVVRPEVNRATEHYSKNRVKGKKEGPAAIDAFEKDSKEYLEGLGWNIKGGDQKASANIVIGWFGGEDSEGYQAHLTAIRDDDEIDQLKSYKDAYRDAMGTTRRRSIQSRHGALPGDNKIASGNILAKNPIIANEKTDAVLLATQPGLYMSGVRNIKQMAKNFQYK